MRVTLLSLFAAVLLGLGTAAAAADGEAGLVIDWGDGTTSNYCIAFQGNSISGEQLLARAGLNVNQFSGLVCGINGVGCQHSGTFNSCTCECQDLGGDCVYWAFFSKSYGGSWRYSSTGFRGQAAGDGDMQAWRWGQGSASSAPAPAPVSFEQVCGHPPRSVASPTPPPTATPLPPTATPAPRPTNTRRPATSAPTATTAATSTPVTRSPSPTATEEDTATASPGGETANPETATPSPEATLPASTRPPGESPTVQAPASGDSGEGGGDLGAVAAFAAVAGGLALLAVAGLVWRARHGG